MIEGHPFLYQPSKGTVIHVAKEGVEVVKSWSADGRIVAFVDGDELDYEPDHILRIPSVQLIVASSPKGANQRWIKQLGQGSFVTQLVVDLWSQEELLITGLVLSITLNP